MSFKKKKKEQSGTKHQMFNCNWGLKDLFSCRNDGRDSSRARMWRLHQPAAYSCAKWIQILSTRCKCIISRGLPVTPVCLAAWTFCSSINALHLKLVSCATVSLLFTPLVISIGLSSVKRTWSTRQSLFLIFSFHISPRQWPSCSSGPQLPTPRWLRQKGTLTLCNLQRLVRCGFLAAQQMSWRALAGCLPHRLRFGFKFNQLQSWTNGVLSNIGTRSDSAWFTASNT